MLVMLARLEATRPCLQFTLSLSGRIDSIFCFFRQLSDIVLVSSRAYLPPTQCSRTSSANERSKSVISAVCLLFDKFKCKIWQNNNNLTWQIEERVQIFPTQLPAGGRGQGLPKTRRAKTFDQTSFFKTKTKLPPVRTGSEECPPRYSFRTEYPPWLLNDKITVL